MGLTDRACWREQLSDRVDNGPVVRVDAATWWSGAELVARAAGAASWLETHGVAEGEVLPSLLVASPNAIALTLAGALWDRPVAPLGPRLGTDELVHCIRGLAARILIADAVSAERARDVGRRAGVTVLVLPEDFDRLERAVAPSVPSSQLVGYLHTSGTTGYPKAVPIREGALARRVERNAAALGLDRRSVYVTAAGYHHIAGLGMMLVVLGSGGAIAPYPTFSVDTWRDLAAVGPTHGLLVPAQIDTLLEAGALGLPTLEVLQYGASPIHPETLRRALTTLPATRFVQIYGQTEGSPITILGHDDHLRALSGEPELLASNGRAAPGVELSVRADPSVPDAGEAGEIRARGEHFFVLGEDGWLATGDLGRLDERGYLTLVGRLGDGIIRGGENVFPLEVERVLEAHPGVAEVAVVGFADRRLGQRIAAAVVPAPGHPADERELVSWCRDRLAHFKVPERWWFVEALPRNAAGKLVRRGLAASLAGNPSTGAE
jgi:acyl-CoA synthetase (AMP-forming)/AMP-acid ligase II